MADWDDNRDVDFLLFGSRTCTCCGKTFPANTEHFHRDRYEDDGLRRVCVRCVSKVEKDRYRKRARV